MDQDPTSVKNKALIETFYKAFQEKDAETMVSCYSNEIVFEDPAFGKLKGKDACDMWRMLTEAAGDLDISFSNVYADENQGSAQWLATYTFSKTGRTVRNSIHASFVFKEGRIVNHTDRFSFWKWSGMAFGPVGWLLGWSPLIKNKVRKQALSSLNRFQSK